MGGVYICLIHSTICMLWRICGVGKWGRWGLRRAICVWPLYCLLLYVSCCLPLRHNGEAQAMWQHTAQQTSCVGVRNYCYVFACYFSLFLTPPGGCRIFANRKRPTPPAPPSMEGSSYNRLSGHIGRTLYSPPYREGQGGGSNPLTLNL